MFRFLLLAAIFCIATAARAEFQFVDYIGHNNSTFTVPISDPNLLAPLDFTFEWQWDDWKMTWHVEDLTPADQGSLWEIYNQEDATPFGFDFDRAVDYSLNHWPDEVLRDGPGGNIIWTLPEPTSYIETPLGRYEKSICCMMDMREANPRTQVRLDYVRFYLDSFYYRANEQKVYVAFHTYLIGEKIREQVPEPSSALLALFGVAWLATYRQ